MKKLWLFIGIGIGFVLGSRAGRGPYDRLEAKVRELSGRPEVTQAVGAVSDTVGDVTDRAMGAASDKVKDTTEKVKAKAPTPSSSVLSSTGGTATGGSSTGGPSKSGSSTGV